VRRIQKQPISQKEGQTTMKRFFTFLCFLAVCLTVVAESKYKVNFLLPSTSPYYSTNIAPNVAADSSMGGLMATNTLGLNSTNNAVWSPLLKIGGPYDSFDILYTFNTLSNAVSTNYLFLFAVEDGVNYLTNAPIWTSGPIGTTATNGFFRTNLPASTLGQSRFFQLGVGNQGTNGVTIYAQVFLRLKTIIIEQP
jgi:hypothetical protein